MDENSTGVFNSHTHIAPLPDFLESKNASEEARRAKSPSSHFAMQRGLSGATQHFESVEEEPEWTTNLERLIALYRDKCAQRILVHREAATYYNRRLKLFSVPGAILGALGASTVFVTWKSESCQESWHEVTLLASGVCMLISTALNALVAQSQYQALFAAHLKSYRNFDKMLKKLTVELCFERRYRQNVRDFIETMLREYDHLVDEAELVPTSVEKKIKRSLHEATLQLQSKENRERSDEKENEGDNSESESNQSSSDLDTANLSALESGRYASRVSPSAAQAHESVRDKSGSKRSKDSPESTNALSDPLSDKSSSAERTAMASRRTTVSSLMRTQGALRSRRKSRRPNDIWADAHFAVNAQMPLTSMVSDVDGFALTDFAADSRRATLPPLERAKYMLSRLSKTSSHQLSHAQSHRDRQIEQSVPMSPSDSLLLTAQSGDDDYHRHQQSLQTNGTARFAQAERTANEESHQTLVHSLAAQGMDALAKSHERSRSPSSSPSGTQSAAATCVKKAKRNVHASGQRSEDCARDSENASVDSHSSTNSSTSSTVGGSLSDEWSISRESKRAAAQKEKSGAESEFANCVRRASKRQHGNGKKVHFDDNNNGGTRQ